MKIHMQENEAAQLHTLNKIWLKMDQILKFKN